jgi:hypothetical protein
MFAFLDSGKERCAIPPLYPPWWCRFLGPCFLKHRPTTVFLEPKPDSDREPRLLNRRRNENAHDVSSLDASCRSNDPGGNSLPCSIDFKGLHSGGNELTLVGPVVRRGGTDRRLHSRSLPFTRRGRGGIPRRVDERGMAPHSIPVRQIRCGVAFLLSRDLQLRQ